MMLENPKSTVNKINSSLKNNPRIAFLMGYFPFFTEAYRLDQYIGLVEKGYDVSVFAWNKPEEVCTDGEVRKYRILEKTHYYNFNRKRTIKDLLNILVQGIKNYVKAEKAFKEYWELSNNDRSFLNLLYLSTPLLKEKYDILHVHFGHNGLRYLPLKFFLEIPFVISFYGKDVTSHSVEEYSLLFQMADAVTVLSDRMGEELINLGCPRDKITKVHVWIHPGFFQGNRILRNEPTTRIFSVGRAVEKKGFAGLITAVNSLIIKGYDLKLDILGDGPLLESLKEQVQRTGSERIKLWGSVDRKVVCQELEASDIFVLNACTASDGDQEGTPTVLMEAGAVGLPVVSTFHTGIPEVVVHGKTGLLVKENDTQELARAIETLLNDTNYREQLGANGKQYIQKHYSIESQLPTLENLYHTLAKSTKL
ncbi:MAG: glycosyltransferase [Bacteroidetes bacterium]|nr:glycosyltransferase [Bacteroidota bacterium]